MQVHLAGAQWVLRDELEVEYLHVYEIVKPGASASDRWSVDPKSQVAVRPWDGESHERMRMSSPRLRRIA